MIIGAYRAAQGGVAEWPKAAVLKTVTRKGRGFESYPLRIFRQVTIAPLTLVFGLGDRL